MKRWIQVRDAMAGMLSALERARRELGWEPRVPFQEGLAEVVEWIEAHWDEVLAAPHDYRHRSPRGSPPSRG